MVLGVNPDLTWRDVQHILANSSTVIDDFHSDWWVNGGGYKHNHNYGFGLINPGRAVEMAKVWKPVPKYYSFSISNHKSTPIKDGKHFIVSFSPKKSKIRFIEHIEVELKLIHDRKGQLDIKLVNDFGTVSHLSVPHEDFSDFPLDGWIYTSVRHWGENVTQNWKLIILDSEIDDDVNGGMYISSKITFYGQK